MRMEIVENPDEDANPDEAKSESKLSNYIWQHFDVTETRTSGNQVDVALGP